eukprot:g38983.t1
MKRSICVLRDVDTTGDGNADSLEVQSLGFYWMAVKPTIDAQMQNTKPGHVWRKDGKPMFLQYLGEKKEPKPIHVFRTKEILLRIAQNQAKQLSSAVRASSRPKNKVSYTEEIVHDTERPAKKKGKRKRAGAKKPRGKGKCLQEDEVQQEEEKGKEEESEEEEEVVSEGEGEGEGEEKDEKAKIEKRSVSKKYKGNKAVKETPATPTTHTMPTPALTVDDLKVAVKEAVTQAVQEAVKLTKGMQVMQSEAQPSDQSQPGCKQSKPVTDSTNKKNVNKKLSLDQSSDQSDSDEVLRLELKRARKRQKKKLKKAKMRIILLSSWDSSDSENESYLPHLSDHRSRGGGPSSRNDFLMYALACRAMGRS